MPYDKNNDFTAFLDELKYKCDIVSIISQYIPLSKKSNKYFGCCPFHNEKTASFCVNPDGQYYHCFGCGVSGNVINFVQEMESLSFIDAVKYLADKVGMALPEYKADPNFAQKKEERDVLKQLMLDAARFYRNNLLKENAGREAREYLAKRGITDDIAKRFGMGLSLDEDSLQAYMRRKNYKIQNLRDCGLVSGTENKDCFANRVIVPIMNGLNEVVAFGGRIFHGEKDVAKYKNSTNTKLFNKSQMLFGINFIKKEKKEGRGFNEIILVEGYMDVIALASVGIFNVVAGMGTALTEGQANEIKRLVPNVYVCYDGDSAGHKASIKNIDILSKVGLNCKIVSLDDGFDPDDTVKQEGYDGFIKRMNDALPLIDYKLKLCADLCDLNSADGKAKFVKNALTVLEQVETQAEREVYYKKVSEKSGVSVDALRGDWLNLTANTSQVNEKVVKEKESKTLYSARYVLNRLLNNKDYADYSLLKREWLALPVYQSVYDFIVSKPKFEINISQLFDVMPMSDEINGILDIDTSFDRDALEMEYYYDCLNNIANEYISGRLAFLKDSFKTLSSADEKRKTTIEIAKLTKQKSSNNIKDKL